jgi:hypothetical protein
MSGLVRLIDGSIQFNPDQPAEADQPRAPLPAGTPSTNDAGPKKKLPRPPLTFRHPFGNQTETVHPRGCPSFLT